VADIQFTYQNAVLIKRLVKRGLCIKNADWEGLKKADAQVQQALQDNFEALRTPVSVFVTFESEEGYNRALAIKEHNLKIDWMGRPLLFDPAPEPTDIIWENRELTNSQRLVRLLITIAITLVLLGISFTVIIVLKQKSMESNQKYGDADCLEIARIYSAEKMKDYSIVEWYSYYKPADPS
jgi:Cytosolic domain of 10TM putative phosphate transporter